MSQRTVTLKGNPVQLAGDAVGVGDTAPGFTGTGLDLGDVSLADYAGKTVILSTVPSLDTGTCDLQTKRFNKEAGEGGVAVLTVSCDLPFAMKRWCGATDSDAVVCVSDFKQRAFGKAYGLEIADGPLQSLITRSVMVVDPSGKIVYQEIVPEIANEPNYDAALDAAKAIA
ncbi:MAG: thiol peroxidase [Phycisphaerales bacterium JB063]